MTRDIHRIRGEQAPAKWYKNLKTAIDKVGLPANTTVAEDELKVLLAKADADSKAERYALKGTSKKTGAYITDAGKECGRAIFFSFTSVPETDPPDHNARLLFTLGHAVEEAYVSLYEKGGRVVEREVPIEFIIDGVRISGRIDFLLDGIVELKSTQAEKFKWIVARKEGGREEHRTQINLYVHRKNLDGENIPGGRLRYIITDAPKGTPSVLEYFVPYDKEKAERDLARLVRLWKMAQANLDPGIPDALKPQFESDGLPKWPCLWCNWRSICKKEMSDAKGDAA